MVDGNNANVQADEFDAEMGELFSAFDGMGASDALKAKTIGVIAATAGATAAAAGAAYAATGEAGASAAGAAAAGSQPAAATSPGMTASAGGKFAAKVASSPIKIVQVAAIAACVTAATVGGIAYVTGVFAPDQALEVAIESTDSGQADGQQGDASSNGDSSDQSAQAAPGSSDRQSQQDNRVDGGKDAASASSVEPSGESGESNSGSSGYDPDPTPSGGGHRFGSNQNYWQEGTEDENEKPITLPGEEDYGVRGGGPSDDALTAISDELVSHPDWDKMPEDWSKLPDDDSFWKSWEHGGWGSVDWNKFADCVQSPDEDEQNSR